VDPDPDPHQFGKRVLRVDEPKKMGAQKPPQVNYIPLLIRTWLFSCMKSK
jgi:hypothetical protein